MKFIDLFAGIGGFRLGMGMAGHKPVGWCEKDKFAQKSYKTMYNTKGEWFADDIRTVKPKDMPEFDCITGGFPCQSFSIAGKRGGLQDTRGTLFFEIARIIRERKPKLVFLENVKGLLNHDGGRTFGTILNTFGNWGMMSNGNCLTARILEYHKIENGCSLSDILEEHVDEKYFLSEEQMEKVIKIPSKL